MGKFNKKEWSWILYDCANSAYSMAVTALFPLYFSMFKIGRGMELGYFNSLSSIIIAIISPVLGTIADYRGYKKKFFLSFLMLGIVATGTMAIIPLGVWQMLVLLYIFSAIGFSGANIFYDAFLVDVTTEERMDGVSTSGFAFGYITSVLPGLLSLFIIFSMGMDRLIGYQIGFLITSIWWGLLSIPIIKNVNQVYGVEKEPNPVINSFKRLFRTIKNIREHKIVFTFLIGYFLYIDGVDTIIRMVVPYSREVIGAENLNIFLLLRVLIIVQIVSFPSAIIYGKLSEKYGTRFMIIVGIITYMIVVIFAYLITSVLHVLILGLLIASAQGGIQALSRSYFAKIIPKENSNEFFGFYNIFGKFAAVFGPLIMALIADITQIPRYSILGILPLFLSGLFVILKLPKLD